jgi:hypothetical protein
MPILTKTEWRYGKMDNYKPEKDHCPVCSTKWTVSGFGKKIWYDCGPCVKTAEEISSTSNTDHLLPEASFQIELDNWEEELRKQFEDREKEIKKLDDDVDEDEPDEFDWNDPLWVDHLKHIQAQQDWIDRSKQIEEAEKILKELYPPKVD